jgi:DNA-binding CsgD family transcriptional regulator
MRAIELAAQVSELEEEAHARYEVASVLHHLGDLHGARRHARALLDVAERSRDRIRRSQAFQTNAIVSFLAGDLPAARDFCDSGLQVSPTAPVLLGYRGLIAYTAGDFEEGKIYLEKLMDRLMRYGDSSGYRSATLLVLLIARITEIAYWIEFIEDAIQKVTLSPSDHPATSLEWRTGFALLSVYRGDVTTSQEYYYALEKRKSTMLGGATDSAITADRLLGLLSHTMGNLDQASTHFEDAQMFCRKAGYLPELAWSCYDYAQTLLQRGHLGDELKAATMLDEAQVIATEIGMLPLVSLAVALQERFKAQPILSLVYPDGLTPREVEILRLVGAGKSNPEIAKALYISPRTVSTHVSHILNKINAANRTEAASYANRHGLV